MPSTEESTESAASAPQSAGPLVRALSAVLAEESGDPADRSGEESATAEALLRRALGRRHVEVEEVVPGHLLFRFAGFVIGGMQGSLTTLVSQHARRIAGDPKLLERFLSHADVAVPERAARAEADRHADEDSEDDSDDGEVEVPEGAQSELELEVLVVGDDVVAALLRTPPFESTDRGPVFTDRGGQRLAADVTDQLGPALQEMASDAVAALPGLAAGSVLMRTPSLDSADDALVTGLEVSPDICAFHRPDLGKGRDAAGALAECILRRASR